MAPRRGLTVYPGANVGVDFSALAGLFPSRLARRSTSTRLTTAQLILYISLGILGVTGIFCALVVVFWWRGNARKRKRGVVVVAGMGGSDEGKGKYGVLRDQEGGYAEGGGGVWEMQGEGPRGPVELDGFVAAPRPAARAELS